MAATLCLFREGSNAWEVAWARLVQFALDFVKGSLKQLVKRKLCGNEALEAFCAKFGVDMSGTKLDHSRINMLHAKAAKEFGPVGS